MNRPPPRSESVDDKIEPKTRLEHFLGKIGGNEKAQDLEPKTRMEHLLADIAGTKCSGGSGVFFVPSHTEDDGDNSILVLEKTAAEIKAAMDSHNIVCVYVTKDIDGGYVNFYFDIIAEYVYAPGDYLFNAKNFTVYAAEDNDYPRERGHGIS